MQSASLAERIDPPPSSSHGPNVSTDHILRSLDVTVPQSTVSSGYGIALGMLAIWLTLIPLIFLAMLAFLAYLVVWHAYQAFDTFSDGPFFVFHVPMALLGGLLLLFLIKPVFFRRRPRANPILTLTEAEEPLLFEYVRKLCNATRSKPPTRIEVDCDANAHARLRRGILSTFGGDLVLRIGLPLAGELSLRQFTGVLAHEFGHFNQRHGMSGSYLIRRLSSFFAQIVFQRDRLDEKLLRNRRSANVLRKGFYWILLGPVEAARGVLWLMLVVGELPTCGVLRRMEYDADRMEALVAGTGDFIRTSHSLAFLQPATRIAHSDIIETLEDRRLADDLPGLIVANGRYLARTRGDLLKRVEQEKTRWFDSHPSHNDRIRQVELLACEGLLQCDAAAGQLFADFGDLCRRATTAFYQANLGAKMKDASLVPTATIAEERTNQRQAYRTLRRFLRNHVVPLRPIFPAADADRPLEDIEQGTAMLRASRFAMMRAAEEIGAGGTQQLQKDEAVIVAARAQVALCGAFGSSPQIARIHARASSKLRQTVPLHDDALRKYGPFAEAARERLTTALRLLHSDAMPLPRAGGGSGHVSAARARTQLIIGVCRSLERFVNLMNRLADLGVTIRVITPVYNPRQPHPPLVRQILGACNEATDILRTLWQSLSSTPFPFTHATAGISVGGVMVPRFPDQRDPADVHACIATAVSAYELLIIRALAELTQQAEEVEEAANLDALPEPVAADDSGASAAGRGRAWVYWLSYGGRAAAGVTMFAVLVWYSINPPVLPEMPWDDGSAPGGYQPNAFHVPFTPPQRPMGNPSGYAPGAPGSRPGAPGPNGPYHPGQAPAPMRPGAPRPPGSPQRQPSNPYYQPSGPSHYSPSPWGGGGGGGGSPGHGGGGGGGGHR